jgi:hypothetical protein
VGPDGECERNDVRAVDRVVAEGGASDELPRACSSWLRASERRLALMIPYAAKRSRIPRRVA